MILYLDTSAMVGLYVRELSSRRIRRALEQADHVVTSLLAYPEALAAFARQRREKALTEREHERVLSALRADWVTWIRVPLDRRLLPETARLLKHYPLTGADAVHLASALTVQRRMPGGELVFACNDAQLRAAASADGLDLV